jgi:peptidoglycan hydrolase CwlO-like protein
MKKILCLMLLVVITFSFVGCAKKSPYEKLMDEKNLIDRRNVSLVDANAKLNEKLASLQKEIQSLNDSLKKLSAENRILQKELTQAKSQIQSIK